MNYDHISGISLLFCTENHGFAIDCSKAVPSGRLCSVSHFMVLGVGWVLGLGNFREGSSLGECGCWVRFLWITFLSIFIEIWTVPGVLPAMFQQLSILKLTLQTCRKHQDVPIKDSPFMMVTRIIYFTKKRDKLINKIWNNFNAN